MLKWLVARIRGAKLNYRDYKWLKENHACDDGIKFALRFRNLNEAAANCKDQEHLYWLFWRSDRLEKAALLKHVITQSGIKYGPTLTYKVCKSLGIKCRYTACKNARISVIDSVGDVIIYLLCTLGEEKFYNLIRSYYVGKN